MKFKLKTNSTPACSRSKNVFVSESKSSNLKYSLSVCALALLPPAPLIKISHGPKSFNTFSKLTIFSLALVLH